MLGNLFVIAFVGILVSSFVLIIYPDVLGEYQVPKLQDPDWWGKGPKPAGAEKIPIQPKPFKIKVEDNVLDDLKKRLSATRYSEPLEDSQFHYGFPGPELKKLVNYWTTKYDWRKHEAHINSFQHFKAKIEGLDIHYIHAKPTNSKGAKVIPLLLVHGWPGSVVEFLKIIPILTTPKNGYVFEVFCPSIPGYGYSDAPQKKGFNTATTARIFDKLMTHFHKQYYVQGGDWGSWVVQWMALFYPERVLGMHLNMPNQNNGISDLIKISIGAYFPSLFVDPEYPKPSLYPFKDFFGRIMLEMGYFHIQATKPDTVGSALMDSPAGLAAYIVEKFSTWTSNKYTDLEDGGLTKKFTMDELLTNVMVYWTTNTITSSVRYYKENLLTKFREEMKGENIVIKVPAGIAVFPDELLTAPKSLCASRYRNILTYNYMPRGGHFAAFEEPQLLADDVFKFIETTEKFIIKNNQK